MSDCPCDPRAAIGPENTRCDQCGCCNHQWQDNCPCDHKYCGCWENAQEDADV